MNGADEGISKKEEVRSAVEIRFTDFMELQGRTQTHSTFIEYRSDTDKPKQPGESVFQYLQLA